MGHNDHASKPTKREKKSSGALAGKWTQAAPEAQGMAADWDSCDATALHALVVSLTRLGCAVILGYTSDGGACIVTVLDGPDRYKEYIPATADLSDAVWKLVERTNG